MQSTNEEKKLRGFGDLIDAEKAREPEKPLPKKSASKPVSRKTRKPTEKHTNKKVSNITFAPVTFKGDRQKIMAIRIWGLSNNRKLQDLIDEALTDLMDKLDIPQG